MSICAWIQRLAAIAVIASPLILTGCTKEEMRRLFDKDTAKSQPEPVMPSAVSSTAVSGTIGQLVTIDGLRLTHVRGFGLVVDLVDTGGSDGPEIVKNYLAKEIRRWQDPSQPVVSLQEMLESRDAAMVEVTGLIPASARKGDRFDVVIRALGSQTKSLVGGRLVLSSLKLFADTPAGVMEGKELATAAGPVFVSPLDLDGKLAKKVDLRTGWVLGGGIAKEDRRVRLVLNDPRYSVAQQIVARLNGRYSTADPMAVGQSPSFVDLHIPDKFLPHKRIFLERVLFTTMIASESFLAQRTKDLAEAIVQPGAEYESIGLAWEAIGATCLPTVRELYTHATPEVSYYAGRTGMRLGDQRGMEAVARHAKVAGSELRDQAIDELGLATDMYSAGECLRGLLNEPDANVRIRAYKALRQRPHKGIQSKVLYEDNLILDIVDSSGPFLIYVQRSMVPRIAVFGSQMACKPPAIYPGGKRDARRIQTQISAAEGADSLTVIYNNKRTRKNSPPLSVPLTVTDLIEFLGGTPVRGEGGKVLGLGAPYSEIVDILAVFCDPDTKTIPATFVAEDLEGKEEVKDESERERKESEY
jgi:hypothetical protein